MFSFSSLRSRRTFKLGACFSLASALGISACLAQETYESPRGNAGAAGKPTGPLDLGGNVSTDPAAPGDGAAPSDSAKSDAECSASRDCAPPSPYCLVSAGVCVECLTNYNCAGSTRRFCDVRTNTCVECLLDDVCPKAAPYCAASLGSCVECLSSANCGEAGLTCDRLNYRCVETCQTHEDCAGTPQAPFCDPDRSLCVACLVDEDCPSALPRCEADAKSCVGCVDDVDCPPTARFCDEHGHACKACLTNHDCPTGASCSNGACVEPK